MGNKDFNPNGYKSFKEAMDAYIAYKQLQKYSHNSPKTAGKGTRSLEKGLGNTNIAPPSTKCLKTQNRRIK